MNIWEILGIAPTDDVVAIKKAYAAKAKEYHPEEHPEKFKELQNAYKRALGYAKFQKTVKRAKEAEQESPNSAEESEAISGQPEVILEKPGTAKPHIVIELGQMELPVEEEVKPPEIPEQPAFFERKPKIREEDVSGGFQNYDYGDVQRSQENPLEQLYEEFQFIKWHPALRNRSDVWRYYFCQQDREELFRQDEVRAAFVQWMVKEKRANWHFQTINYITRLLERSQNRYRDQSARETQTEEWKSIQVYASTSDDLIYKPFLTNKEKKFFCQVEGTTELLAGKQISMHKYWNDYMTFARMHKEQLEEWYKWSTQKRTGASPFRFMVVISVFLLLVVLFGVIVSSRRNTSHPPYEETLEELRRYNEERYQTEE